MGDNCANITVGEHEGEAPINLARFHLYKEWTADLDDRTLMMVSDVKDVYFQTNPFPMLGPRLAEGKDFFVFEELKSNTIAWDIEGKWVRLRDRLVTIVAAYRSTNEHRTSTVAGSWHASAKQNGRA